MKNPRDRILAAIIILMFIIGLFSVIVMATENLNISAKSAYLYEYNSKKEIYSKNANAKLPMASTTKIMTALVALENTELDRVVKITKESVGIEGSSIYLKEGEELLMEDLLYSLMLRSANDAAVAIAIEVGGSLDAFVGMMNDRAEKLSLVNTHFDNPHGLDSENHYTTARELALITAEAMKNPIFSEITSTYKRIIKNSDGESRLLVNHNKLLKSYEGTLGVKTGYTKKSGRSLVGCAERDGVRLISVTINAPNDWNDHKRMFDFGFSMLKNTTLAAAGQYSYNLPVVNSEKECSTVKNYDSFSFVLNKTTSEITTEINLPRYIVAPIKKNEKLGEVVFLDNGKIIGKINLYATEDINEIKKGLFK